MRRFLLLAALWATPATAQSEDLLECPSQQVSVAFREKIADAAFAADSPEIDALYAHLSGVARECAGRFGLPEQQLETYFGYVIARLSRDSYIERLAEAGISAALVDEALDFGPGRSNRPITGDLSEAQHDRLHTTLVAGGIAIEKVSASTWQVLGAYIATSSHVWHAQAKLP